MCAEGVINKGYRIPLREIIKVKLYYLYYKLSKMCYQKLIIVRITNWTYIFTIGIAGKFATRADKVVFIAQTSRAHFIVSYLSVIIS